MQLILPGRASDSLPQADIAALLASERPSSRMHPGSPVQSMGTSHVRAGVHRVKCAVRYQWLRITGRAASGTRKHGDRVASAADRVQGSVQGYHSTTATAAERGSSVCRRVTSAVQGPRCRAVHTLHGATGREHTVADGSHSAVHGQSAAVAATGNNAHCIGQRVNSAIQSPRRRRAVQKQEGVFHQNPGSQVHRLVLGRGSAVLVLHARIPRGAVRLSGFVDRVNRTRAVHWQRFNANCNRK
jgi:hypothetical protein